MSRHSRQNQDAPEVKLAEGAVLQVIDAPERALAPGLAHEVEHGLGHEPKLAMVCPRGGSPEIHGVDWDDKVVRYRIKRGMAKAIKILVFP